MSNIRHILHNNLSLLFHNLPLAKQHEHFSQYEHSTIHIDRNLIYDYFLYNGLMIVRVNSNKNYQFSIIYLNSYLKKCDISEYIDSGTNVNLFSEELLEQLNLKLRPIFHAIDLYRLEVDSKNKKLEQEAKDKEIAQMKERVANQENLVLNWIKTA